MTDQHLIAPPPGLVQQWWKDAQQADYFDGLPCWLNYVAIQAAQWGADQELEACAEHLKHNSFSPDSTISLLRAARRADDQAITHQPELGPSTIQRGSNVL